jgi:hypothetical protein
MMQPLEHYTERRHDDLELPSSSDSANARHGYAKEAMKYWGGDCAYCGRDLIEDYESWLHLSVDHVVPSSVLKSWGKQCASWIGSRANLVPCCRACNEFLSRHPVGDDLPNDEQAFIAIRDRVIREKREKALRRHAQEMVSFHEMMQPAGGLGALASDGDAITQRIIRSRIVRLTPDSIFRS